MEEQGWKDSLGRRLVRMLARRVVRRFSWRLSLQLTRATLLPRAAPQRSGLGQVLQGAVLSHLEHVDAVRAGVRHDGRTRRPLAAGGGPGAPGAAVQALSPERVVAQRANTSSWLGP